MRKKREIEDEVYLAANASRIFMQCALAYAAVQPAVEP